MISIIIPVYNVEKYLERCVVSVCNQTYDDLEIILVDDGSTDKSGIICDRLAQKDNRITVYHKENQGLGLTRNYGMNRCNGKYIMFLDSDDYIDKTMLENMVNVAENKQADLVISGFKKVTEAEEKLFSERYEYEEFIGDKVKDDLLPRMIGSMPQKRDSIFTMACGKLYNKESIEKSKIKFPSERKIQSEDLAFQLDYIPSIQRAIVINGDYYNYRVNSNSLTMVYKKDRFDKLIEVYLYVLNKIKEHNLPEKTFLRADKMFFVQFYAILQQEVLHMNIQNLSKDEKKRNVKNYINHKTVRKIIDEYPIGKLKLTQKIFVLMIKYRTIDLLILALKLKK